MRDLPSGIEFRDPSLDLSKLPLFGLDVGCNGLSGEERF